MPTRETERVLRAQQSKMERRLVRAIALAVQRIRQRLPLETLAHALEMGEPWAKALVDKIDIEDAYVPSTAILRDAFVRGGKAGAEDVRRLRRG